MSRRATCLLAAAVLVVSACSGTTEDSPGSVGTSQSPGAATVEPAPVDLEPAAGERLEYKQPLAAEVTDEELRQLIDEQMIPVGPTHGSTFETMINAMTLQDPHDVILFGDSMTQQGIDPGQLGQRLSEAAGSQVSVFNAASSRARW